MLESYQHDFDLYIQSEIWHDHIIYVPKNLDFNLRTSSQSILRVVQTQVNLFLKSMSERDGSDIERFWILNDKSTIVSKSIEYDVIEIQSRSLSDPSLSDIDFKNKNGSGLNYL